MTVEVLGKEQRGYKTTQELYTLKYADVLNLIKENGSLDLKQKSDMDKAGVQAHAPKNPPRSLRPDRTSSEPNLLPPLNKSRLMKETSWFRYAQNTTPQNRNTTTRSSQMSKVKEGEKKKVRALSPINSNKDVPKIPVPVPSGPVLLSHSPYKLEDPYRQRTETHDAMNGAKKKRKKENQNKENSNHGPRPARDKFVDYLNQKRELTKQIHLRSNHVDFHERPGQGPKTNRMSYPMVRPRYKEELTIKNKLEEFKRWHEQEYRLRYTKTKIIDDVPKVQRPTSAGRQRRLPEDTPPVVIKQIQALPEPQTEKPPAREESSSSEQVGSKRLKLKNDPDDNNVSQSKETSGPITEAKIKQMNSLEKRVDTKARRTKSTRITVPPPENEAHKTNTAQAPASAKTWRTWRAPDTSCAYQDVKQYIEDNELMPEAKEKMIKQWIQEVDRHMTDIQEENEEIEIGESYPEPVPIETPSETLTESSGT